MKKKSEKKPAKKPMTKSKKWARRLIITSLLFISIIGLLPIALELAGEKWLKDNGAIHADIGDIELNIFTAQLSISDLNVSTNKDETFSVGTFSLELNWHPLRDRRIVIKQISLGNTHLDIHKESDKWLIGQLVLPSGSAKADVSHTSENEEKGDPWFFGLNALNLNNIFINYRDEQIDSNMLINHVKVNNIASWDQLRESNIYIDLNIDESRLLLDSEVIAFSEAPKFTGTLKVDRLNISNYKTIIEQAGIKEPNGYISTDLAIEAQLEKNNQIYSIINGKISINDLKGESDSFSLNQEEIEWEGRTEVSLPANPKGEIASLAGALSLSGTDIKLPEQHLNIQNKHIIWEGELTYGESSDNNEDDKGTSPNLSMLASINAENLNISDTKNKTTLISNELIQAKELEIKNTTLITLSQLIISKSKIIKPHKEDKTIKQLAYLGTLIVNNIESLNGEALKIHSIRLNDLQVDAGRSKNGDIKYISSLQDNSEKANKQPETTDIKSAETDQETNKGMTIAVGEFLIAGQSWIKVIDNAVQPSYITELNPIKLSVSHIDNSKPTNASKTSLETKIGKYTSLKLDGDVYAFAEEPTVNLTGKLSSLDLPPLSSYTAKYLGYNLKRGTISSDISINIDHGKLDITNDLKISKLNIIEMDKEKTKGLTQQLAMPLDAALDMLRDGDDNIEFEITIDGDVNDPKFDPSGIINLAMGKALKAAAMSYVKNALQPLGTIMLVGDLIGKATALRFEPVIFMPGSSKYNQDGSEYIDKIATLLQDRPNLQITICGISTPKDKNKLLNDAMEAHAKKTETTKDKPDEDMPIPEINTEQLTTLAKERGEKIKSYFVSEKGINSERIFSCHPSYSDEDDALPSAEISL